MDGRIKDYYFDEINNMDDFDPFFEDEMEAMYQPVVDKKAAKAAAKAAAKDLKEEFIEEDDNVEPTNDDYII
jgi:hypothetical protein